MVPSRLGTAVPLDGGAAMATVVGSMASSESESFASTSTTTWPPSSTAAPSSTVSGGSFTRVMLTSTVALFDRTPETSRTLYVKLSAVTWDPSCW